MAKTIKIALDAGHGFNTPGKRCFKAIDPNETREWTLNSRIVEKVQKKLEEYENIEVLRVDDPTGKTDVSLGERCRKANEFRADIYCSFHHDAGVNGGSSGGLTAITYSDVEEYIEMRNLLYNCLINAGGIRGNRSTPTYSNPSLYVLNSTKMKSVLVEHGFMDSTVDTPIILTDEYAEKLSNGWIVFFEKYLKIKKNKIGKYKITKSLNIRKKPSITSKKIGTAKKNTYVNISKTSGAWGYLPAKKGWISLKYSKLITKEVIIYSLSKALNIRKTANIVGKRIRKLNKDTQIEVSQIQNGWGYVEQYKGWICLKHCKKVNE